MTLLDEDKQKYCYGDDEVFWAGENRWNEKSKVAAASVQDTKNLPAIRADLELLEMLLQTYQKAN